MIKKEEFNRKDEDSSSVDKENKTLSYNFENLDVSKFFNSKDYVSKTKDTIEQDIQDAVKNKSITNMVVMK